MPDLRRALSVFAGVPKPNHEDCGFPYLVPYFIASNQKPSNFARLKFLQDFAHSGLFGKTGHGTG